MLDFAIRHADALIPLLAGVIFLAEGLRRTLGARNGRRLMQAGALLVLVGFWGISRPAASRAATNDDWTAVSEAGRFSVLVPPGRKHSEFDDRTPYGPARTHKWNAAGEGGTSYIFRYSDLPAGAEYPDAEAVLDAMAKAMGAAAGSRVTATRPVTLGGFPGREIEAEVGGSYVRAQVFVTPTRAYALVRTAPKDAQQTADPFFTSFTLAAR